MVKDTLEVSSLDVRFGKKRVLKEVSLSFPKSSVVGFVGPNGSGKTTLLRTLAGLLKPHSGTYDKKQLGFGMVAYVPQSPKVHQFSVKETIAMGRYHSTFRFSKLKKEDILLVEETLKRFKLDGLGKRRFDTLSGGERQRVVLARAVCQNAPFLVLDEPTSGMDIKHRLSSLVELKKEAKRGKTVLITSHDVNLASRFFDYTTLLKGGEVVAFGPTKEVINKGFLEKTFQVTAVLLGKNTKGYPVYDFEPLNGRY